MDTVFVSRVVDREFEPSLGQNKDYKFEIYCFADKHAIFMSKSWFRIKILCPSPAKCLPVDCCICELAL
jgi:hypothetical protein